MQEQRAESVEAVAVEVDVSGLKVQEHIEFKRAWADRSTRADATRLAIAYVAENRDQLEAEFGGLDVEGLVQLVDSYRRAGRDEDVIRVEIWLQSEFEPQSIVGEMKAGQ